MDFKKYENTLPLPHKGDFSVRYWYKAGRTVARRVGDNPGKAGGTTTEWLVSDVGLNLGECQTDVELDKISYHTAQAAFHAETNRNMQAFREDFFAELGIENNPKRDKLFSKAWEHGHASGFSEVMNCGYDLVELIQD